MLRRPPLLAWILVAAFVAVVLRGWLAAAEAAPDAAGGPGSVGGLGELLLAAGVGRVLLAVLPPGGVGSHGLRDLPLTWAASHLLGSLVLAAWSRLLPLPDDPPSVALFLAPWIALGLARWATLPAAMVPRHEPPAEPLGRWLAAARVVFGAVAATPLVLALLGGVVPGTGALSVPATASRLATLLLLSHALRVARRTPGRYLALALAALSPQALWGTAGPQAPLAALGFAAGASAVVPWLRRADRRAAVLAAAALTGCLLAGAPRAALGGGLVLVLFSARPSRPFALAALGAGALAALGPLALGDGTPGSLGAARVPWAAGLLPAAGLGWLLLARRFPVRFTAEPRGHAEEVGREALAVVVWSAVGLASGSPALAWPSVFLATALLALRPEHASNPEAVSRPSAGPGASPR